MTMHKAFSGGVPSEEENHDAAMKGGEVGKKALKNVEAATKKKVVSSENYLNKPKAELELPDEK